ncbi:MAG: single-stranded-DNA-specific exonuclease RecJ [Methylococcales bacterium]|jgi:single-stranded-DNA-specific exonuclease|nr:single-stranded-DNA-specific exonuclease RecJ [Methylococcales bacterium]MBT7444230.1 single-stranded-DNA-specific exonuclease RecJ [Methylococcales bacterium]
MAEPKPYIKPRPVDAGVYEQALQEGLSPLLARVAAGRYQSAGDSVSQKVSPGLSVIASPKLLLGMDRAVARLVEAVTKRQMIAIVTDYDVDGITSHAVIFRTLTQYFHFPKNLIVSLIGHRINDGYGLSDPLVDRIEQLDDRPSVMITADCGSSDEPRIARLKALNIDVIVTDHHAIPAEGAPASALAVINPAQATCQYPDATIAGCMVSWLLMSQLRAELVSQNHLPQNTPKLASELDWVALGTVADCVSMGTAINRAVVIVGLKLMNGMTRSCWRVAAQALGKAGKPFDSEDLGFQIGPRINARSRMSDPYAALRFVLSDKESETKGLYQVLDEDNQSRKLTEQAMVEQAKAEALIQIEQGAFIPVVYLKEGHPGVQGIVAARIMQWTGCPALVLCPHKEENQLTGSARSILEVHIRDALQLVADAQPDILVKFGGHKGAAGLTIWADKLPELTVALNDVVAKQLNQQVPSPVIWTDGELEDHELGLELYHQLQLFSPWGREFEKPVFEGLFYVDQLRAVGKPAVHLSLRLATETQQFKAIWFRALPDEGLDAPIEVGDVVRCAYTLAEDDYQQKLQLQLIVDYAEIDE